MLSQAPERVLTVLSQGLDLSFMGAGEIFMTAQLTYAGIVSTTPPGCVKCSLLSCRESSNPGATLGAAEDQPLQVWITSGHIF